MMVHVKFVLTEPMVSEIIEVYRQWTNDKDRRQVMAITKDTCISVTMLDNNSFKETFQIYISINSYKH